MLPRRYSSIVYSSIVGCLAWWFIPESIVERSAFLITTIPFSGSESVIDGDGTPEKPYAHKISKKIDFKNITLPTDIIITDDPNQIFQSSPPSPVDFAIILKNLTRIGHDSIAISTPLTWSDPEAIPLAALDQQLDATPNLITASPLSRSATPSHIPPAFRRASIPSSQVHGNISQLPIVNRIPIPGVLLGNKTSLAGFTVLESEPETTSLPLLAVWDDRVVFSFQLLATLNHLNIPLSSIEIRLGRHIYLGKNSYYIPIDSYGNLSFFPNDFKTIQSKSIPAEDLLDAAEQKITKQTYKPVIIRNTHSAQDPRATDFSNSLIPTITLLSNPANGFSIKYYANLTKDVEILFIAALLSLIFGLQNFFPGRQARIPLIILTTTILALHFIIVLQFAIWIPTLPALATLLTALFFARRKKNQYRRGRFTLPW